MREPPLNVTDADVLGVVREHWLGEVTEGRPWFEAPHAGTEDDRIAFGGLLHELAHRGPGWTGPETAH